MHRLETAPPIHPPSSKQSNPVGPLSKRQNHSKQTESSTKPGIPLRAGHAPNGAWRNRIATPGFGQQMNTIPLPRPLAKRHNPIGNPAQAPPPSHAPTPPSPRPTSTLLRAGRKPIPHRTPTNCHPNSLPDEDAKHRVHHPEIVRAQRPQPIQRMVRFPGIGRSCDVLHLEVLATRM